MSQKRVAVVGAGPSGLTAIKTCKEAGLDAVCFERNGDPGGLWRYHEEDLEGVASVMATTIINTSKEMSAFSDFPPPRDFPNYMHNSMMYKYFMLYAEKFDLFRHIRYYQEVVKVVQASSYNETGRWLVTTRDSQSNTVTNEEFDAVMVCIGHHVYPKVPSFPGQEKFRGTITHTHSLKKCDGFAGKRVVVVGIGNSGVDASVDCTPFAKQVYLSTRRGSWIFSRVGVKGRPFDIDFSSRKKLFLFNFSSYNAICSRIEAGLNDKFDHALYNLKPKHRALSAHPTMNDALPNFILSGRVVVKGDVVRFEENGILFEGDEAVTELDAVVLATGYHVRFPFLDDDVVSTGENRIRLYKYALPPQLKHPTLALIGLVQPIGAIFPVSEMFSRWFVQVLTGKLRLPSSSRMEKDIDAKNAANAKRYVTSTRHTIQVDWVPFMDELASEIGAKPNMLKMAVTDPKLFWTCFNGPVLPYQFRLQGPHPWQGAREAILNLEDRLYTPLQTRCKGGPEDRGSKGAVVRKVAAFAVYGALAAALFWRYAQSQEQTV